MEATSSRKLFRIAGWCSTTAAILIPVSLYVFAVHKPPYEGTAIDWIAFYQGNWLVGLIGMDLPLLFTWILLIPIYLGVFFAVQDHKNRLPIFSIVLFIVALASYVSSNTSIEMLSLSNEYYRATGEVREGLLGAAQSAVTTFDGTAFHVSYIVGQLAGILLGISMLGTKIFRRATAWLLIGGNAIGYALYIPVVGLGLSAVSGIILWVWFGFMARDFFRLSQG